jgi:hypothetical protein
MVGFVVCLTVLMAGSWLAARAFEARLPVEARSQNDQWLWNECVGMAIYLALIVLHGKPRARFAVETILPIGLFWVGFNSAGLLATLILNVDSSAYQSPVQSVAGLGLIMGGAVFWMLVGRSLSLRAAAQRLRREAIPGRRAAWFAEVGVDRSWRRSVAYMYGIPIAALIAFFELTRLSARPFELLCVGMLVFAVGVGDHLTVSITDAAIKVRTRWLSSSFGWGVALAEVASARVIEAHPETLALDRNRCILRTGPALEISTTAGATYAVSLEEAEEAVVVLGRLGVGAAPPKPQ